MALGPGSIVVIGAGAWGTALAVHFGRQGRAVVLTTRRPEHGAQLRHARTNSRYLPGVPFPSSVDVDDDFFPALTRGASAVVIATPCQAFPSIIRQISQHKEFTGPIVWACKGFEIGTGRLLHQVFFDVMGSLDRAAVLSGPTFSNEVAQGLPTAVTLAAVNSEVRQVLGNEFHCGQFRVYLSDDLIGVELGGAIKNVYAIASGIADGLAFGSNAQAALITRALAELRRLGAAMGANAETIFGLAGLGDLVLTCTGDQSRNRRLGVAVGRGQSWQEASAHIGHVVEGVYAAQEVGRCAAALHVDMPIARQVAAVLHEGVSARDAVRQLLERAPRAEFG